MREGLYFWNKRTEDALTRSLEYFKEAIEKDPSYAQAWAGLADTVCGDRVPRIQGPCQ
jgi:hypothetical protein